VTGPVDQAAIAGAVARGWCHPETEHLVMDPDLAYAIALEVWKLLQEELDKPRLGCATTLELTAELHARAEVAATVGERWPNYRTVDS
jgi:hypothetical protein